MPKIDRDVAIETTWSDYETVLDVDRGSLSVVEPATLSNEPIYPPVDKKPCSGTIIHRESVSEENLEGSAAGFTTKQTTALGELRELDTNTLTSSSASPSSKFVLLPGAFFKSDRDVLIVPRGHNLHIAFLGI